MTVGATAAEQGGRQPESADDRLRTPRRLLVLSADMGGGHDATARALEESAERLWPGSEVRRLDILDVMGGWVGRAFRWIYVSNVETTPWLYEFFYSSVWRRRWFARSSKRFTGEWAGRRLVPEIDRFDPDMILSTYPLATSGLAWLRRHRGLQVPTGCWISDFAPHPFWVYADVDANFVMDAAAVPVARGAEPDATVTVAALPVVSAFGQADHEAARNRLGLRPDATAVLVSCGAYAFGSVERIVRALLAASDRVQVVAACGRNDEVRGQLSRLGLPDDQLRVLGWTDDMAGIVAASDLVLTNAGGATALEALTAGVPVVTVRPIAAHGKANSDLMAVAGLAEVCSDEAQLTRYIRAVVDHPESLKPFAELIHDRVARRGEDLGLLNLATSRLVRTSEGYDPTRVGQLEGGWPMRSPDAFFAEVETDTHRQELGTVIELDAVAPGRSVSLSDVHRSMQGRAPGLNSMRRVVRRSPFGWDLWDDVDVSQHITELVLPADASDEEAWRAVDTFWSQHLPDGAPGWQMQLIHGAAHGRSLFAIKMHHSQADGISAIGLLDRLLDHAEDDPLTERKSDRSHRPRVRLSRIAKGIASLAANGFARRHPMNRAIGSGARQLAGIPLPLPELRRLADRYHARPHEVVVALAADAFARLGRESGVVQPGLPLRAMIPVASRPPRLDRVFGNWTGSLSVDLPVGRQTFPDRLAALQAELRRRAGRGEPEAATMVMLARGVLPMRLRTRFSRAVYQRRFFNTIVSYMPAARRPRWCAGARVAAIYPVVPLAPGVPLTLGVVVTADVAGVGVLCDRALGVDRDQLASAVREAFVDAGGRFVTRPDPAVTG